MMQWYWSCWLTIIMSWDHQLIISFVYCGFWAAYAVETSSESGGTWPKPQQQGDFSEPRWTHGWCYFGIKGLVVLISILAPTLRPHTRWLKIRKCLILIPVFSEALPPPWRVTDSALKTNKRTLPLVTVQHMLQPSKWRNNWKEKAAVFWQAPSVVGTAAAVWMLWHVWPNKLTADG